jgi:hypothetical protein
MKPAVPFESFRALILFNAKTSLEAFKSYVTGHAPTFLEWSICSVKRIACVDVEHLAVSGRLLTAENGVFTHGSLCCIFGGQSDHRTNFD